MRVQAKTLPLLRQSFAIWQAKRYLNVSVNYETNIYFDFEFFRFVYTL